MLQIVFKKRNWNFQNTFNNLLFITNFFLISHMLSDFQMKNYFITGNKSKKKLGLVQEYSQRRCINERQEYS